MLNSVYIMLKPDKSRTVVFMTTNPECDQAARAKRTVP